MLSPDAERGAIEPDLERDPGYALAGAILMDLAARNRVDTGPDLRRTEPGEESRDPLLLRVVDKIPPASAAWL